MPFNSLTFAIFLPIVFILYWTIPYKFRWILMLVASYYFYMSWNAKYVLFGSFFVDNKIVKYTLLNNNLLMQKYLNYIQKNVENINDHKISETTIIYLTKMQYLCEEHGIKLDVKPNPLSDIEDNYEWEEFEEEIVEYGLEALLGDFIENNILSCGLV